MSSTAFPRGEQKSRQIKLFRLWRAGEPAIFTVLVKRLGFWQKQSSSKTYSLTNGTKHTPYSGNFSLFARFLFAFYRPLFQASCMTQPLALVLYEKLLPGSQLVNRLQDLNYRVQTIADPASCGMRRAGQTDAGAGGLGIHPE